MPGVPSSRGCEACRKRKKKCDLAKPTCSRCSRLGIPCVGSGQQRFKFQPAVTTGGESEQSLVEFAPTSSRSSALIFASQQPSRPLYNEVTVACGSFVSTLVVSDPRYDVTNLGGFLEKIPQRMGRNKALDISVRAFTGAISTTRSGQLDVQTLVDYGNGMKMLRTYLTNPKTAKAPETLVATYLLSLCQAYLGADEEQQGIHMQGVAHIVEAASLDDWKDPFHGEVLVSCAFGVVLTSITEPYVKLSPSILEVEKIIYGPNPDPLFGENIETRSLKLESLLKFPEYMKTPELHMLDIQSTYDVMSGESRRVSKYVNKYIDDMDEKTSQLLRLASPMPLLKTYFAYEAVNLMLLTLGLVFNKILRVVDPDSDTLKDDLEFFCRECIRVSKRSYQFRPLGCSLTPASLGVVWASSNDEHWRGQAQAQLDLFQDTYLGPKFMKMSEALERRLNAMERRLSAIYAGELDPDSAILGAGDLGSYPPIDETDRDAGQCIVM